MYEIGGTWAESSHSQSALDLSAGQAELPGPAIADDAAPSTGVVPFSFEGAAVRVVTLDGEPWFVLADVCRVLELSNPSMSAAQLDDDERAKHY